MVSFNPVAYLREYFRYPFLESDTFSQMCRKSIITSGLVISLLNLFVLMFRTSALATLEPSVAVTNYFDNFAFLCLFPVYYAWMRYKRYASDRLVATFTILGLLVLFYQSVRDVIVWTMIYVLAGCMCIIISQHPDAGKISCFGVVIVAFKSYNLLAVTNYKTKAKPAYVPVLFAEPWGIWNHCNDSDEFALLLNVGIIAVTLWLTHMQTKAFEAQLAMTQCNTTIARNVAELLSEYYTEEASVVLSESGKGCDEALLDSLKTIVLNMEAYRPYLPNYLLTPQRKENKDDDAASTEDDEETASTVTSPQSTIEVSSAHGSKKSSQKGSARCSPLPSQRNSVAEGVETVVSTNTTTPLIATQNPHQHHHQNHHHIPHINQESTFYVRPVTLARMTYRDLFPNQPLSVGEPPSLRSSLSHMVEIIHQHATTYSSAVHSFLGDEVFFTWNATTRCVDHQYRGASMVMILQKELFESSHVEFHGAILSGLTRCQRAGTKTFAWTLHAPMLFRELQAAFHIPKYSKGGIIVTNATHMQQIEHSAKSQAIDAIQFSSNSNTVVLCVLHELLEVSIGNSSQDEEKDSEWMYRINSNGNEAQEGDKAVSSQVSECLNMALKGESLGALQKMEMLMNTLPPQRITGGMEHLLKRLNQCVEERTGKFERIIYS